MIAAGAVGIIVAILIGMPLLRLKGHYFALASLGAAEAVRQIMDNLTDLCGGAMGLTLPQMQGSLPSKPIVLLSHFFPPPDFLRSHLHYFKKRLGYALKAIKANEEAADAMGINTTRYKIVAWAISGIFTAIAGGSMPTGSRYRTCNVFDVMIVVKLFVILLLGEREPSWGPSTEPSSSKGSPKSSGAGS